MSVTRPYDTPSTSMSIITNVEQACLLKVRLGFSRKVASRDYKSTRCNQRNPMLGRCRTLHGTRRPSLAIQSWWSPVGRRTLSTGNTVGNKTTLSRSSRQMRSYGGRRHHEGNRHRESTCAWRQGGRTRPRFSLRAGFWRARSPPSYSHPKTRGGDCYGSVGRFIDRPAELVTCKSLAIILLRDGEILTKHRLTHRGYILLPQLQEHTCDGLYFRCLMTKIEDRVSPNPVAQ